MKQKKKSCTEVSDHQSHYLNYWFVSHRLTNFSALGSLEDTHTHRRLLRIRIFESAVLRRLQRPRQLLFYDEVKSCFRQVVLTDCSVQSSYQRTVLSSHFFPYIVGEERKRDGLHHRHHLSANVIICSPNSQSHINKRRGLQTSLNK